MATFLNFFPSAKLDFAVSESLVNGPIVNFSASVTVTSSLSASGAGNKVVWGASSYGVTGYNTLTLVDQTISGSNLQSFIELTKIYAGIDIGAICTDTVITYITGSNLIALFATNSIILDTPLLVPTLLTSSATLSFGAVYNNSSEVTVFNLSGEYLSNDITITAPDGFTVSTNGAIYTSSLVLPRTSVGASGGTVAETTIYTLFTPVSASEYTGSIDIVSSPVSASIFVTGSGLQAPVLTTDLSSLPDFGSVHVFDTSSDVPFVVSGSYLANDIYITAPTGFLISDGTGTYFDYTSGSWIISQSGGSASATMYATFAPIETGSYDTSYTITSNNATTIYVLVTGTGTP